MIALLIDAAIAHGFATIEAAGGFARLDRVFGGRLAGLLGDINEAAWKDTA